MAASLRKKEGRAGSPEAWLAGRPGQERAQRQSRRGEHGVLGRRVPSRGCRRPCGPVAVGAVLELRLTGPGAGERARAYIPHRTATLGSASRPPTAATRTPRLPESADRDSGPGCEAATPHFPRSAGASASGVRRLPLTHYNSQKAQRPVPATEKADRTTRPATHRGRGARGRKAPAHALQLPESTAPAAPETGRGWGGGEGWSDAYASQEPPRRRRAWREASPSQTTSPRTTRGGT